MTNSNNNSYDVKGWFVWVCVLCCLCGKQKMIHPLIPFGRYSIIYVCAFYDTTCSGMMSNQFRYTEEKRIIGKDGRVEEM